MHETLFAKSGLSLDRLRSFHEIVCAKGIMAASAGDPSRQSQLSRQLRELEVFFGVELIRRGRGPQRLTPAGLELHRLTGKFLGALGDFLGQCGGAPVELRVGAGESLVQWWLLPRLSKHSASDGTWTFAFENLRNDEMVDRVLDGSLDLAVTLREGLDSRLCAQPLGRLEYALFVPRQLSPGTGGKVPRQLLHQLPLAVLMGGETILKSIEAEATRTKSQLNIRLRLSSYPQMAAAVREGLVAAVMPTLARATLPESDVTQITQPFLNRLSRRIHLVWNRSVAEVRPVIAKAGGQLKEALTR